MENAEGFSENKDSSRVAKIAAFAFAGVLVATGLGYFDDILSKLNPEKKEKQTKISKVEKIAYGADKLFSPEEKRDLALAMGYDGLIDSADHVRLNVTVDNQFGFEIKRFYGQDTNIIIPDKVIDAYIQNYFKKIKNAKVQEGYLDLLKGSQN